MSKKRFQKFIIFIYNYLKENLLFNINESKNI